MALLILNEGSPDQRVFELHEGANTIGRAKTNDVYVLHKSLSRVHAQVSIRRDGASVEDLGSKNGVSVDGARIQQYELHGAHRIKCGDLVFSFVGDDAESGRNRAPTPTFVVDMTQAAGSRRLDQLLSMESGGSALNLRATSPEARARDKLQILLRVSALLASPAPIDDVLARILELVFEVLDVDRAAILMAEDGDAEPRVTRTRPGAPARVGFSRQIVRYVIDHGVAALFADALADPRLADDRSLLAQSVCASMCAPLRPRDQLLGVLYVDNVTRPERFGQEDLEFLSSFANQAGIAIDNAILSAKLADEAVSRSNLLRFFPPRAIDAIIESGGSLEVTETEASVLFCDISGYTALSSKLEPRTVIALLNTFFPVMSDIVFRHEGTLEKFIGDALLAVWGAPFAREDDAVRAVRAAIDMQRAVSEVNSRSPLSEDIAIHVGINSGRVAAGNIGSQQYLQYATIGDATNVAARICSVAKEGEIWIDERTAERLGTDLALEPLGEVYVKGKTEPVRLFRVPWR